MKLSICCVLLASMIQLSGCRLQQACCDGTSYYDASEATTPRLAEKETIQVLEPPTTAADVQPFELPDETLTALRSPELPVETPLDVQPTELAVETLPDVQTVPVVRPIAVDEPAVQPLTEEPLPVRRATRKQLVPLQLPHVTYNLEG